MIPFQILIIENNDEREFMIKLYEKYHALMIHITKGIIYEKDTVDDLVQDVFVKLIEKVNRLQQLNPDIIPAYLSVCMKRTCYNHLKKQKTKRKYIVRSIDDDSYVDSYSSDSFEAETIMKIDAMQLKEILHKLPQKQQDILEYKYILEISDAEIGEIFEINKNSVRQYLTRARRAAYDLIKENDYE